MSADGTVQHVAHFAEQPFDLWSRQRDCLTLRGDARVKQDFIAVNVANASHSLLVHQPTFNAATPLAERDAKAIPVECQRVRPKMPASNEGLWVVGQRDTTELARRDIGQAASVGEADEKLGVSRPIGRRSEIDEPPGHAEVQDQPAGVVHGEEQVFPMPARPLEATMPKCPADCLCRGVGQQARRVNSYVINRLPQCAAVHVMSKRFDVWELGHRRCCEG